MLQKGEVRLQAVTDSAVLGGEELLRAEGREGWVRTFAEQVGCSLEV